MYTTAAVVEMHGLGLQPKSIKAGRERLLSMTLFETTLRRSSKYCVSIYHDAWSLGVIHWQCSLRARLLLLALLRKAAD
jgi:hypothetical protein